MAETSTAVIASANNLSVKYGTQVVLDGATIAFREGEHIGLVGRNGSGKSTFLQIAAGVAQADSGEIDNRRCDRHRLYATIFRLGRCDHCPCEHSQRRATDSRPSPNTNVSRATARSAPRSSTKLSRPTVGIWNIESKPPSRICTRRNPIASWARFPAGKNAASRYAGRFSRVLIF